MSSQSANTVELSELSSSSSLSLPQAIDYFSQTVASVIRDVLSEREMMHFISRLLFEVHEQSERLHDAHEARRELQQYLAQAKKDRDHNDSLVVAANNRIASLEKKLDAANKTVESNLVYLKTVKENYEGIDLHSKMVDRRVIEMLQEKPELVNLFVPDFSLEIVDRCLADEEYKLAVKTLEELGYEPVFATNLMGVRKKYLDLKTLPESVKDFILSWPDDFDYRVFRGVELYYVEAVGPADKVENLEWMDSLLYLTAVNDGRWHMIPSDAPVKVGCSQGFGWYRCVGIRTAIEEVDFGNFNNHWLIDVESESPLD